MDSKKTLKPELKEIYERVMSTKAAPRATPPTQSPKPATLPTNPTPAATTPEKQSAPPAPAAPVSEKPATPTASSATPEPYLPSSAPRAIPKRNDTYIFSSSGKNNTEKLTEKKVDSTPAKISEKGKSEDKQVSETKKSGSSLLPVLIVVITLFLILYTVFWAFYFNII